LGAVTVGVDIGQRRDPTAIAVVEQVERRDSEIHHDVRHLERLDLGTPYPGVAKRVAEVVQGVHAKTSGEAPTLYVDATGVGTPIVDVLKDEGVGDLAQLVAVYFTYGDRRKVEGDEVKLGKAWLVSRMQALLQSERLHLPRRSAEAEVLAEELLDYEIRITEDANDRYGAFRVGTHDDLVTALGLATQDDRSGGVGTTFSRDPYTFGDIPPGGGWPSF
jgi:hypothetical protein